MLVYAFDVDDFLRTRFAISPLHELVGSVAALRDPAAASIHVPWIRAVRPRLTGLDLALLHALVPPGGYRPDFVAPPPRTPVPEVGDEIDRIRAASPEQVRRELRLAYPERPLPAPLAPLLARPRAALAALADLVGDYWERALAPHWESIRETLEDDIAYRTRALTAGGPIDVFDELHPEIRWRAGRLEIERPYTQAVDLAGHGLMLIPSVFVWPRTSALWEAPWQPAVFYPARGVGYVWAPTRTDSRALSELMGERRATILARLDGAATTTALARRFDAPASSVSSHLGVLRRAGLVRARRRGREVLYSRTPAGDALLRAAQ